MELAVLVLRDLLQYSAQLPELARDIGTNHIPGLLTSLLALKPEVRPPSPNRAPLLEGPSRLTPSFPPLCSVPAPHPGRMPGVHDVLPPSLWLLASKYLRRSRCVVERGQPLYSGLPVDCLPPFSPQGKLATYFLSCMDAETPHLQQVKLCLSVGPVRYLLRVLCGRCGHYICAAACVRSENEAFLFAQIPIPASSRSCDWRVGRAVWLAWALRGGPKPARVASPKMLPGKTCCTIVSSPRKHCGGL